MEKIILTTQSELQSLIFEGVKIALTSFLQPNSQTQKLPTGTREEVSQFLQISVSKLDQMTKTGELKSFKLGRQVRFKWLDIDEYLKNKKG